MLLGASDVRGIHHHCNLRLPVRRSSPGSVARADGSRRRVLGHWATQIFVRIRPLWPNRTIAERCYEGDGFEWAKVNVARLSESGCRKCHHRRHAAGVALQPGRHHHCGLPVDGSVTATCPVRPLGPANVGATEDRGQHVWRIKEDLITHIFCILYLIFSSDVILCSLAMKGIITSETWQRC